MMGEIVRKRFLTPRFPMRQIGAYWPLRRDSARLRDRRMLWINYVKTSGHGLARRFDTIRDILRSLSLTQSLLKSQMHQFEASGTQWVRDCRPVFRRNQAYIF